MIRAPGLDDRFPHVGMSVYFTCAVGQHRELAERVAQLLVDKRWPWIPWFAQFVGVHKRDDAAAVRVGGKNGHAPLVAGFLSPRFRTLRMNRAKGDGDFTSVQLPFEPTRAARGDEAPYTMEVTCRSAELPEGKTFGAWISLAHDLVATLGALHATIGAWPTYNHAIRDTWHTRILRDAPTGDTPLNDLPSDLDQQIDLLQKWRHKIGRTYARHPRWGTYLNAAHVAAVGGLDRIRAEVDPARLDAVGDLTYIQLTPSIETGMSADAGVRRRKLEALMAPILVGA